MKKLLKNQDGNAALFAIVMVLALTLLFFSRQRVFKA